MKYNVYLINWDKILDNTLRIERDFLKYQIPHTIVNSSDIGIDGWMNIGNDQWANQQLKMIYQDAHEKNFDYIFLLYGDVKTEGKSFSEVVLSSIDYLNENKCAIYTKSFTFNHWGTPYTIIEDLDDGIKRICATDYSFVAISKDVIDFMFNFFEYFYSRYDIKMFKSAWGLDFLCWIYAIYKKESMIRDTNINLIHDISETGYDQSQARWEMNLILEEGLRYMDEHLGCELSKTQRIKEMLIQQYNKRIYNYGDFYGIE